MFIKDLFSYPTVAELTAQINHEVPEATASYSDSFVTVKKGGSRQPLYIICGSGGSAFTFQKFANMLAPDQPVYSLQQPSGSMALENTPLTIEGIASKYLNDIETNNPVGPYALSGHCTGGIIAFEIVRQLREKGKKVSFLGIFDTILNVPEKIIQPRFANGYKLPYYFKKAISKIYNKLHFELFLLIKHPVHAFRYKRKYLDKILSFTGLKKNRSTDNFMDTFYKVTAIYENAAAVYKLQPYDGKILIFYAKEPYYSFQDHDNNINYKKMIVDDKTKDQWKKFAKNVTYFETEGQHTQMFNPDYCSSFAKQLQQALLESAES